MQTCRKPGGVARLLACLTLATGSLGHRAHATDQRTAAAQITIEAISSSSVIALRVEAGPGLKFNFDGPWKLEVRGLATDRGDPAVYTMADLNRAVPAFTVLLKSPLSRQQTEGEYLLTYFLCDTAETWCKRLQARGPIAAQQPPAGQ
jgi:hypothetical protein